MTTGRHSDGVSRSVEQVRLKQTQEIELARSISESRAVTARVHLAIPEKSVFARLHTADSICVRADGKRAVLSRSRSMPLTSGVILGAFHGKERCHCGGSVRYPSAGSPQGAGMMSDAQLEHRIRLEDIYRNRVIALVSPIVGVGNVTAQVNLDIDFTRSEITEELMDPEGNVLRSEQRTESSPRSLLGCAYNQQSCADTDRYRHKQTRQ